MDKLLKLNITNQKINILNVIKNKDTRIGFYFGSFDPFHNGHTEVVNVMLKYCDVIFITTVSKNPKKPNLLSYEHRVQMINNALIDNQKPIYFIKNNLIDVINDLYKDYYLIGIMGSDVYINFINQQRLPKMKVHEWFIIPRISNQTTISPIDFNKKVTILSIDLFQHQHYSSTYIRRKVNENELDNLPLSANNIDYIKEHHLYQNNTIYQTIINEIEQKDINSKQKYSIIKLNGCSGNNVYEIKNDNKSICIVKKFKNKETGHNELLAYKFLKRHHFLTAEILYHIVHNDYFYLFMEKIKGKSLGEFIIDNQFNYKALNKIGYDIGIMLRKLHEIDKVSIYDKINKNKLIKLLPYKPLNDIRASFLNNPGYYTYVHGDPSPNNLFVNDYQQITIIDPSGLIANKKEMPQGFPSCDYHRFLFSIKIFSKTKDIDHTIDPINVEFINGYGLLNDIFTHEANVLFQKYWDDILFKLSNKISK